MNLQSVEPICLVGMEIHESPQRRAKIIITVRVRMCKQTLLYAYILTIRVVIL